MAKLNEIVLFLNKYLEVGKFPEDSSWNGLQVEGGGDVKKIVFGVTAGLDLFKKAKEEEADMIVCHHGIFWKEANPSVAGYYKDRIELLLDNNTSLYACHLPLDAHRECGNNAEILRLLNAEIKEGFSPRKGESIGWIGECSPRTIGEIAKTLEETINAKSIILSYGKKEIKKIAVVSGGAPHDVFQAIEKGVDLFITGDAADITEVVKDAKINVIFAGHYATETTGVRALLKIIKEEFGVEVLFIDVPTNL